MRVRRTISFSKEDADLVALLDAADNASRMVRSALRAFVAGESKTEQAFALLGRQHDQMVAMIKRLESSGISVRNVAEADELEAAMRKKLAALGRG